MDIFAKNWQNARGEAEKNNLRIIEHGWEQHVIIDELHKLVYRYPRHQGAADKLSDEVAVLGALHKDLWPVDIPDLLEHTDTHTKYRYVAGEVLDPERLNALDGPAIERIGHGIGTFLGHLHLQDPSIVALKSTKQTMSLLEYYGGRILEAHGPHAEKARAELQELKTLVAGGAEEVVVHGDLHGLNMVIDPVGLQLNGVIDFSELEVGDPHQDFRKIFMTHSDLLGPALVAYGAYRGVELDEHRIKLWAYVNEWANVCYFADNPENQTYQRAVRHLEKWGQL